MHASAMPRIRLPRRRQTPALSARHEVHWPRPRNFQARNGDQGEPQSPPPVLRRRSNARSRLKFPQAVAEPSAQTAFSQRSFCIGFATQKLLIRYGQGRIDAATFYMLYHPYDKIIEGYYYWKYCYEIPKLTNVPKSV